MNDNLARLPIIYNVMNENIININKITQVYLPEKLFNFMIKIA